MNINDFAVLYNELDNYKKQLAMGNLSSKDIEIIQKKIKIFNFIITKLTELKYEFSKIICFNSLLEEGYSWDCLKEFFDNDDFISSNQKNENTKLYNDIEKNIIDEYYKYIKSNLQNEKYCQDEENDTTNTKNKTKRIE